MEEEKEDKAKSKRNLIINIVLLSIIVILIVVLVINKYVIAIMTVSGDSMYPTLEDRQKVLVKYTDKVAKGDIVVFKKGEQYIVKRVIATEGDVIEIKPDGTVVLNGKKLDEPYVNKTEGGFEALARTYNIAKGEIFVLGDNRPVSYDSENYGPINVDNIVGKLI